MKLLKFYTDCCPQCKQQSKILEDLKGIEIEDINCEDFPELVTKYQVRSLPSMVLIDDNNNFLRKIVGVTSIEVIQGIIDAEKEEKWDM